MSRKTLLTVFSLCCAALLLLSGCAGDQGDAEWGATCRVYLDNLPEEFALLPQSLRDNTEIRLTLQNPSADRDYSVRLNEENGYAQEIPMLPGTYSVSEVYVSNLALPPIQAATQVQTVQLQKDTRTELPVSLLQPEELVRQIGQSQPTPEILAEQIYSRKVQYAGTILDLTSIRETVQFTPKEDKRLASGEVDYIPAASHSGVALIVQNTTEASIPIQEAAVIGVRFSQNNAVLPGGISVGTTVEELAHAENGLMGTPSYCLGTPLIGMGLESTTLVYLDQNSGDRVSFLFHSDDRFVSAITYEFERYQ